MRPTSFMACMDQKAGLNGYVVLISLGDKQVRQLRHDFRAFLARFSAPIHPARAVCYIYPTRCPCWPGADWCLESDVVTDLGLLIGC